MTYDLQTLLLIEADTIAVLVNIVCGMLIWRSRLEVPDRSRTILLLIILTKLPFIGKVASLMTSGLDNRFVEVLPVVPTMSAPLTVVLMMLYAVELMRPNWLKWRHFLVLFSLLALIPLLSVLFKEQFTVLHSLAELRQHIGEANVMLRMVFNIMTLLLCLSLLWLPYRWQESSASRRWGITYVCFISVIGALFHTWTLTLWMPIQIVHNLMPSLFAIYYTWYELHERILPPPVREEQETVVAPIPVSETDDLWLRIVNLIHEDAVWRNPDLGLEMFCQLLGSNKDYVNQCFRKNADTTFVDYVNRLRIEQMADELRRDPMQSQKELFFRVGFRSRTTAWRNFQKYLGVSPTEFIASLAAS